MARRRGSGRFTAGITGAALGIAAGAALGAYVLNPAGAGIQIGGGDVAGERDAAIADARAAQTRVDEANRVLEPAVASLVDGALKDTPVVVVAAPDADSQDVTGVSETLKAAGALDGGTLKLSDKFLHSDNSDQLKDVVTASLPADTKLDEQRRDPGRQAGQALSSVLQLNKDGGEQASGADRSLLLGSLRDAGFIDYKDGTMRPSAVVVLVTGAGQSGGEDPAFGARVLADFAEALSENGSVVVAGTPAASEKGGVIDAIKGKDAAVADKIRRVGVIGDAAGRIGLVQEIKASTK